MSKKFRLDRKIGFQNMLCTKCINVLVDSIGPSIILRSIYCTAQDQTVLKDIDADLRLCRQVIMLMLMLIVFGADVSTDACTGRSESLCKTEYDTSWNDRALQTCRI